MNFFNEIKRPMRAAKLESIEELRDKEFPLLGSIKYDGFRLCTHPPIGGGKKCRALSRTLKPIRNAHIRELIENFLPPGIEAEILTYETAKYDPFNVISEKVTAYDGCPKFHVMIFDYVPMGAETTMSFMERFTILQMLKLPQFAIVISQRPIATREEALSFHKANIENGYEGTIFRRPSSPYRFGKLTRNLGYVLKLKEEDSSEAYVVDFVELQHNDNEATTDELGYTKRSTHQANKRGGETLGAFICSFKQAFPLDVMNVQGMSDLEFSKSEYFKVGTGVLTATEKAMIWNDREKYRFRIINFKHQKAGEKEKPRFGRFHGWRHKEDIVK